MTIFLTIIHVIVCFILILVILLQAGRGQGLTGASFGSGNVQSLFGTRAADFLTKATTVAAICFIVTCISLDFIEARRSRSLLELSSKQAPVNLDQIKEALEKVKSEAAVTAEESAADTADMAEEMVVAPVSEAAEQGEAAMAEGVEMPAPVEEPAA